MVRIARERGVEEVRTGHGGGYESQVIALSSGEEGPVSDKVLINTRTCEASIVLVCKLKSGLMGRTCRSRGFESVLCRLLPTPSPQECLGTTPDSTCAPACFVPKWKLFLMHARALCKESLSSRKRGMVMLRPNSSSSYPPFSTAYCRTHIPATIGRRSITATSNIGGRGDDSAHSHKVMMPIRPSCRQGLRSPVPEFS